jgi:hypothetical protein
MSKQIKRREPGKRVYPSDNRPQLVLVPSPQKPIRPDASAEMSDEVKEMLREMNRRHAVTRDTDAPDALRILHHWCKNPRHTVTRDTDAPDAA